MKVTDSRLDSIRSLVKKLETKSVDSSKGVEGGTGAAPAGAAGAARRGAEVSAAGYGELHLAARERQLARDVELVLGATDPAREARLASLKARIEAGQYQVDAGAVADRLLASGLFRDEG